MYIGFPSRPKVSSHSLSHFRISPRRPSCHFGRCLESGGSPRLTDGQVIVGMARMVAMLHDDGTQVLVPAGGLLPVPDDLGRRQALPAERAPAERDLLVASSSLRELADQLAHGQVQRRTLVPGAGD
jgi:hypothetical protein